MSTISSPPSHPASWPALPKPALSSLFRNSALIPLDRLAWLRITGEDRVRWMNGMVTNAIQTLMLGQGCFNFLLSAQGRIQGTANIFALTDSLLLETDLAHVPALRALLDRFIIMDDVEVLPLLPDRQGLLLAGPDAASVLARAGFAVESLAPMHLAEIVWHSEPVVVLHADSPLVPRFELWASAAVTASIAESLLAAGATQSDAAALEQLRILEGTPAYGVDIRDRDLPQETATRGTQSRALNFTKGCYLGQEIVERIHSRGNVHRSFSGFLLSGVQPAPAPGAQLSLDDAPDKFIGELTSVTQVDSPAGPATIGLGYIRREALERALSNPEARLLFAGGTAVPVSLPFNLATLDKI